MALVTTSAVAQDTITVTGQRAAEKRAQAESFVRKATGVLPGGQFARRASYCPRVFGLAPPHARIVLAAVDRAGAAAGVRRGAAKCQGDLAIIFTADSDALMAALEQRNVAIFRTVSGEDLRAITAKGRGLRWWYAAGPGGADGAATPESKLIGDGVGKSEVMMMPVWSVSLVRTNLAMRLGGSIVVVDVGRVEGIPLGTVAAQAAMVSFAQVSPRADFTGLPSVLAARRDDGQAATADLTAWDKAYLRELYRLPVNREAWAQRATLAARVAAAVD